MLSLFVLLVSVSTGGFSTNNFFLNDGQHNSYNNHQQNILSTNTPFGIVRGIKVMPSGMPKADVSLPPVVQYLGIPYGSAPVGNHRFKMAISAPKWIHQPKDAFKPPPSCIQSGLPSLSEAEALKVTTAQRFDHLHRILPLLKPQSEDCLFMNLFVPERNEFRDSHPLPVLVLIHGDTDYGWGGANAINGTLLASFGQIVVVTLNYRLGIFGFLGRCDLNSCAGNAGLSDLVAALKMLSLILPSFGADPNAVTLLGWESGAALVSLLMASPITQPKGRLFRRAILLDGTALSPWAMANNPQDQFIQLAKTLQEPLLSTTTSTSTKGLIHLGPGISPICPRHGRAAQMLLAAAAANRSGMTAGGGGGSGGSSITTPPPPLQMNLSNNNSTIPPTQKVQANIVDGLSSLNGGACDGSRGNGGGTGFVGGQQQQQRAIEEVQV
ncbi:hypothetical protein ACQ4LE_011210 [Meloidogyne hapla]